MPPTPETIFILQGAFQDKSVNSPRCANAKKRSASGRFLPAPPTLTSGSARPRPCCRLAVRVTMWLPNFGCMDAPVFGVFVDISDCCYIPD